MSKKRVVYARCEMTLDDVRFYVPGCHNLCNDEGYKGCQKSGYCRMFHREILDLKECASKPLSAIRYYGESKSRKYIRRYREWERGDELRQLAEQEDWATQAFKQCRPVKITIEEVE
jgi:hypothetical protein